MIKNRGNGSFYSGCFSFGYIDKNKKICYNSFIKNNQAFFTKISLEIVLNLTKSGYIINVGKILHIKANDKL